MSDLPTREMDAQLIQPSNLAYSLGDHLCSRPQAWEVVSGIPETTDWLVVGVDSDPTERDHINNQLESGEIDINADFLCCKVSNIVKHTQAHKKHHKINPHKQADKNSHNLH